MFKANVRRDIVARRVLDHVLEVELIHGQLTKVRMAAITSSGTEIKTMTGRAENDHAGARNGAIDVVSDLLACDDVLAPLKDNCRHNNG